MKDVPQHAKAHTNAPTECRVDPRMYQAADLPRAIRLGLDAHGTLTIHGWGGTGRDPAQCDHRGCG